MSNYVSNLLRYFFMFGCGSSELQGTIGSVADKANEKRNSNVRRIECWSLKAIRFT